MSSAKPQFDPKQTGMASILGPVSREDVANIIVTDLDDKYGKRIDEIQAQLPTLNESKKKLYQENLDAWGKYVKDNAALYASDTCGKSNQSLSILRGRGIDVMCTLNGSHPVKQSQPFEMTVVFDANLTDVEYVSTDVCHVGLCVYMALVPSGEVNVKKVDNYNGWNKLRVFTVEFRRGHSVAINDLLIQMDQLQSLKKKIEALELECSKLIKERYALPRLKEKVTAAMAKNAMVAAGGDSVDVLNFISKFTADQLSKALPAAKPTA